MQYREWRDGGRFFVEKVYSVVSDEKWRTGVKAWVHFWLKKNNYKKLNTVLSCLVVFACCTCCILICIVCIVASFKLSCVYLLLVDRVYCCSCLVCVCVLLSYVYLLYCVCIAAFTLDAGLLARSQYSEGPATGHLDTGFSWFPCVYKQMLRWFPRFQVATTCFSCSPPDLNSVVNNLIFCIPVK